MKPRREATTNFPLRSATLRRCSTPPDDCFQYACGGLRTRSLLPTRPLDFTLSRNLAARACATLVARVSRANPMTPRCWRRAACPPGRFRLRDAFALLCTLCCLGGAPALASNGCSFPCAAHATCNERERRCDCPPGLGGADCSVLAVPSCVLEAAGAGNATALQAPPLESRSCACILEWVTLLGAQQNGGVSWEASHALRDVACFDAPTGTPVLRVWEEAAAAGDSFPQRLITVSRAGIHDPLELRNLSLDVVDDGMRERTKLDACPLDACPANCSLHGMCERREGGLMRGRAFSTPRCVCWSDRTGSACDVPASHAPRDGSQWCLNSCRGRGTCLRGTCICGRGAWGADCGDTEVGSLRGRGPALQPSPPLSPSAFVYDWPPALVTWQLWLSRHGISSDWGRPAGWHFLETALLSAHRTTVAADATLFVVPVAGDSQVDRLRAFDYAYHGYPHINSSATPTHVWPIMPGDGGLVKYPGVEHVLMSAADHMLPPFFAHSVFLTHHALKLGYSRGIVLDNVTFWRNDVGPQRQDRYGSMYRGFHVPGKDVCAAAADKQEACLSLQQLKAQSKTHLLWWAGNVREDDTISVRARTVALFANTSNITGIVVHKGGGRNQQEGMRASHFCLAPSGIGGGYGSRDAQALNSGCAPVYVQDHVSTPMEDLLPVGLYGAAVAEADLPRLREILNATLHNRTNSLEQLHCACRALYWPWVAALGAEWETMSDAQLDQLDSEGGWASLLMLIDRRRRGVGPLTDACGAVPRMHTPPAGEARV